MSYFLVAVSNKQNLELCIKYALAGFTNSITGLWTFLDIQEGDFVSFLYGARAFNLYQVKSKEAIRNAENVPPWPPVTFRMSGKTYYFPFRLNMEPVRRFEEPLVRAEFAYIAENLLLRGGYRKTHFQADQTTLQAVSQMGNLYTQTCAKIVYADVKHFVPRFVPKRNQSRPPEVFPFLEIILQALIRQYLSSALRMKDFLEMIELTQLKHENLEVLGEKALTEGHIDILIKESTPMGLARKVIAEVQVGPATTGHVKQLLNYMQEMGSECIGGVLIAKEFSKTVLTTAQTNGIHTFQYAIDLPKADEAGFTYEEAKDSLQLIRV